MVQYCPWVLWQFVEAILKLCNLPNCIREKRLLKVLFQITRSQNVFERACFINAFFKLAFAVVLSTLCAVAQVSVAQVSVAQVSTLQVSTVSACDNFYEFANEKWLSTSEIPANSSRVGSFVKLSDDNTSLLIKALDRLLSNRTEQNTPGLKLLAQAYVNAMNTALIDEAGIKAIAPLLSQIESVQTPKDLPKVFASLSRLQVPLPFSMTVWNDATDVRRHRLSLYQNGLGLPDREDYTRQGTRPEAIRAAYRVYVERLFQGARIPFDDGAFDRLMALEARLASAHLSPSQMRDPRTLNNPQRVSELQARAPGLAWDDWINLYLQESFADTEARTVNIAQPAVLRAVGILQPPFFDENADDATNYGAIGMVIGHEIIHHFDDRGRRFDAVGNLRDWWTPEDDAAYRLRAQRVIDLYSSYQPLPGQFINGTQMLDENISDIGGAQIAFEGLQIALRRAAQEGKATPLVDGLSPEQRFFFGTAVIWRSKQRAEATMTQLRTGQHSPPEFRVLGPLSNMEAFAKAYGCKAGDKMVAAEPIVIW
jgi:predicted metalloendopeptidase